MTLSTMDGSLTRDYEDNMNGEPDAVKVARPVRKGIERKGLVTVPRSQSTLRASRDAVFVSPTQLGRIWRTILGSSRLPEVERQRGQEHARKALVF
jgi:hypothetical protein